MFVTGNEASMQSTVKPQIRIGPAGWSYPDWEGVVYPAKKDRSFDPLRFLASYFDLIEINSTFYRVPSRATCRRWVERTADKPDFLFAAKAPQEMTHGAVPVYEREVAAFKTAIEPLFESRRLGAVLIQFPWSFRPAPATTSYVENLTDWFSPFPTAVEVRHGAWGTSRGLSFFRDSGITLCCIDQPLIRDSLAPGTYAHENNRAYFRLHGRNKEKWFSPEADRNDRYNYLYNVAELSFWCDKIREAAERVQNVFVVLNNHFRGQAVVNALQIQAMLAGRRSDAPRQLVSSYPQSVELLRPDQSTGAGPDDARRGQLELFGDEDNHKNPDDADEDR